MYESFYGLREQPFELTTNRRYVFLSAKHREALSMLEYGIASRRGMALLLGEAGTGKSTLVRAALERQRMSNPWIVYLTNPRLSRAEFLEFLAGGFCLSAEAAVSKTRFLMELERTLIALQQAGRPAALIIDEAQSLSRLLLEEVRLLSNAETATDKLLSVVLVGQPELAGFLNEPALRQLKQRVSLRCVLKPLDLQETAAYIAARIRTAGGDVRQVFTRDAVTTIYEWSRGIPRTVSVICDNALISGYAADRRPVASDIVSEVCRDFDLQPRSAAGTGGTAPEVASETAELTTAQPRPVPAIRDLFTSVASARRRFSFF